MSTYYYASFSPVSMSRKELTYKICEIIFELGASVDVDFDRLDIEESLYVPTHEDIENDSLPKAIEMTEHWPGVQINVTYKNRLCNIVLINDVPDKVTLIFSEPKLLYSQQLGGETNTSLLEMLLVFVRVLKASFCVFEPGWIRKSRVLSDIKNWINDLNEERKRDWELVLVSETEIPFASIPSKVKKKNNFKRLEDLDIWYFSMELATVRD